MRLTRVDLFTQPLQLGHPGNRKVAVLQENPVAFRHSLENCLEIIKDGQTMVAGLTLTFDSMRRLLNDAMCLVVLFQALRERRLGGRRCIGGPRCRRVARDI